MSKNLLKKKRKKKKSGCVLLENKQTKRYIDYLSAEFHQNRADSCNISIMVSFDKSDDN